MAQGVPGFGRESVACDSDDLSRLEPDRGEFLLADEQIGASSSKGHNCGPILRGGKVAGCLREPLRALGHGPAEDYTRRRFLVGLVRSKFEKSVHNRMPNHGCHVANHAGTVT
uniref:(northern house mosquito) hypothetical protein n=1 Tax=Culex pipiens TaxID=7175 RepID=A0A8D8ESH6_CULPI